MVEESTLLINHSCRFGTLKVVVVSPAPYVSPIKENSCPYPPLFTADPSQSNHPFGIESVCTFGKGKIVPVG